MRVRGLIALVFVLVVSSAAATGFQPALHVRSLAPFSVRGTHFKPSERVRVTLNGTWVGRGTANPSGGVVVTLRGAIADRCSGYLVTAVGSKGSRVTLRAPALMCASTNPG
jgi:hypothetical protein